MLLAKPIPWPDETAASLLMRAASMNGWSNVQQLWRACGIANYKVKASWKTLECNLESLDIGLSQGPSIPRIASPLEINVKGSRAIGNLIILPDSIFREEGQAVCPTCLQDKPYLRGRWSIKLVATCPDHGCLLLQSCPNCGQNLHWNRPAPELCNCGFDLRLGPTFPGDQGIARFIVDLLINDRQEKLDSLCAIFSAFSEMLSGQLMPSTDEECVRISIQSEKKIQEFLELLTKKRVDFEHPRLVLLPFLRKDTYLRKIALSALRAIDNSDLRICAAPTILLNGILSGADARIALGDITPVSSNELFKMNLLETVLTHTSGNPQKFTRASVDLLLRRLWRPSSSLTKIARNIPSLTKLPKLASELILASDANAGYDLENGLSGLRAFPIKHINRSRQLADRLHVNQTADILRASTGQILALAKVGYLTKYKDPDNGKILLFSKEEVERFDRQYILSSALARSIGASRHDFIHRLKVLGVIPVAGPRIDELTSHLIARRDIANIDYRILNKILESPIKRTSGNPCAEAVGPRANISFPASTVALLLELSVDTTADLINKNILKRVPGAQAAVMISRDSFELFSAKFYDKNLVEVSIAARDIGVTLPEFTSRWIETEIVPIIDLGTRKCILKSSYLRIKELHSEYIKAKHHDIKF